MQVFALFVCMGLTLCWAQAPGDEEKRCTVQHSSPPSYPDTERNLMDSYNYEDLVPGNGTGSIIATAVWNDYSFDGNDVDGIIAPTYVSFFKSSKLVNVYVKLTHSGSN